MSDSNKDLKPKEEKSCSNKVFAFIVFAPLVGSLLLWVFIGIEASLVWLYKIFSQNEILSYLVTTTETFLNNYFLIERATVPFQLKLLIPLFIILIFMMVLSALLSLIAKLKNN